MTFRCLAAAAVASLACAAPAQAEISVSPAPGTPDASPQTEISFLGASPAELRALSVVGSRTGAHPGRLVAYASAAGASFVPNRPFADRERVTVSAPRARLRFSFTVAATAPTPPGQDVSAAQSVNGLGWTFASSPLHPASVQVNVNQPGTAPGDVFVAPIRAPGAKGTFNGQAGPLILDPAGNPVWVHPLPRGIWAMNFHPQTYRGAPVLTWWAGHVTNQGIGFGEDVIVDSAYHTVAVLKSANGYAPDLHEFLITPRGTAFVTAYRAIHKDISAYGGARNGELWDSVVQEVDLKTSRVMFEWHPLAHVSLHDTYTTPVSGLVWDPYHVNSVDVDSAGDVLIGMRNTWAAYDVRLRGGRVAWRLGGKRSSFRLGRGVRFAYQHDARWLPGGQVSIFDDEATPPVGRNSRGIVIQLDRRHRSARLVRQYLHTGILAGSQGNQQALPNGDVFEGWGAAPYFSEFSGDGRLLYDVRFFGPDESYRAFRSQWSGHPTTRPAIAVRGRTVYASWNGATDVTGWAVFAGPDPAHLAPAGASGRTGFETAIASSSAGPYYAVWAYDAAGHVLGASPAARGG